MLVQSFSPMVTQRASPHHSRAQEKAVWLTATYHWFLLCSPERFARILAMWPACPFGGYREPSPGAEALRVMGSMSRSRQGSPVRSWARPMGSLASIGTPPPVNCLEIGARVPTPERRHTDHFTLWLPIAHRGHRKHWV